MQSPFSFEEVVFEATARCNQQCSFCFNQNTFAQSPRQESELTTKECFQIIDNAASSGVKTIRFTGGEPLLRPDFEKLVKYSKLNGLYVKLNTNGSAFSRQTLSVVSKHVDWVLFPIHAKSAETDAEITGNQSFFKKKISTIKSLSGKRVFVCANTLATAENIQKLEKIEEFVSTLGLNYWFVNPQIPNPSNAVPSGNGLLPLLVEKVLKFRETHKEYKLGRALPFCCFSEPERVKEITISADHCGPCQSLTVGPSGEIRTCYAANNPIGNAFEHSLRDVWENNEFVKKFKENKFLPKECAACRFAKECRGGCRISAKIAHGTYDALDPRANPANVL